MKTKTSTVSKATPKRKDVPDDTIYVTKKGTRVRIVKDEEINVIQVNPTVHRLIQDKPMFVVAKVSNGKRWYGYKREDLTPEEK